MALWMSRGFHFGGYTFWRVRPEVDWNSRDEPYIGRSLEGSGFEMCETINIGVLFPDLAIPYGEMTEVEIVPLASGYYIGTVEE